jgi:hypothetical protein
MIYNNFLKIIFDLNIQKNFIYLKWYECFLGFDKTLIKNINAIPSCKMFKQI